MLIVRTGIKEVQIIQWFVEPEARVEQFDKLCEVQSDKAATEVRLSSIRSYQYKVDGEGADHVPLRWSHQEALLRGGGYGAGGQGKLRDFVVAKSIR